MVAREPGNVDQATEECKGIEILVRSGQGVAYRTFIAPTFRLTLRIKEDLLHLCQMQLPIMLSCLSPVMAPGSARIRENFPRLREKLNKTWLKSPCMVSL